MPLYKFRVTFCPQLPHLISQGKGFQSVELICHEFVAWSSGWRRIYCFFVACVNVLLHSLLVEYWVHSPLYLQEMFLVLVE
jgi:hypothetical protein